MRGMTPTRLLLVCLLAAIAACRPVPRPDPVAGRRLELPVIGPLGPLEPGCLDGRCPVEPVEPQLPQPERPAWRTAAVEGLIDAGGRFPGAEVTRSEPHPALMAAAQQHAEYQARSWTQGHQWWSSRSVELRQAVGPYQYAEICAESWPWQAEQSPEALGWEMFRCWQQSAGHWRVASRRHTYWGGGMARGGNWIWYACIIVAD